MTQPWPDVEQPLASSGKLDVSVRVSTAFGWLEISYGPYSLHKESFAETQRTMRRTQTQNPFVPGTFTVNAVADNVTENIAVWVDGDSHYEMDVAVQTLVEALEQPSYLMERRIEDSLVTWWCQAADVAITTQAEYLHARKALVSAQIPRLPQVQRSMA